MAKLYTFLFIILISCLQSKADIANVVLPDTLLKAIVTTQSKQLLDVETQSSLFKDQLSKYSEEQKTSISNLLHLNLDEIYKENFEEYQQCLLLADKMVNEPNNEFSKLYKIYNAKQTEFFSANYKIYLARIFFQLFYSKGIQSALLQPNFQKYLVPDKMADAIVRSYESTFIADEIIFITNNSNIKLFNL